MSNTVKEVDESLELLKETKSNIRSAIEQKGVTVSDTDTFASYATKIGEISSGSSDALKNLSTEQRTQILLDGTYEGKDVDVGEVFTQYDGKFVEFDKTLNPGGEFETLLLERDGVTTCPKKLPVFFEKTGSWIALQGSSTAITVFSSVDLKTWTQAQKSSDATTSGNIDTFKNAITNGSCLIQAMSYPNDSANYLYTSDGSTFEYKSIPGMTSAILKYFYSDGKFYVLGKDSCAISENALDWEVNALPQRTSSYLGWDLIKGDGNFLLITSDYYSYSAFYTSTDCKNWTETGTWGYRVADAAFFKGYFYLGTSYLGSMSYIVKTTDGATKEQVPTPTSGGWYIKGASENYLCISTTGSVYFADESLSFVKKDCITGDNNGTARAIVYADDSFLFAGSYTDSSYFYYLEEISFEPFYEYSLTPLSYNKTEVDAAIAGVDLTGYVQNVATGENSLVIAGEATDKAYATAIGFGSKALQPYTLAAGYNSTVNSRCSTAIGNQAGVYSSNGASAIGFGAQVQGAEAAIQIGYGRNTTPHTLAVGLGDWTASSKPTTEEEGEYILLQADGKIPAARLPEITEKNEFVTNSNSSASENQKQLYLWEGTVKDYNSQDKEIYALKGIPNRVDMIPVLENVPIGHGTILKDDDFLLFASFEILKLYPSLKKTETLPSPFSNGYAIGVFKEGNTYIAANAYGAWATSTDLVNWQQTEGAPTLDYAYSGAVINGTWLVFEGDSTGKYEYSTDNGKTWIAKESGVKYGSESIVLNDKLFLLSGSSDAPKVTTDGINWTACNANIDPDVYVNGVYYGHINTTIYSSTDGITWTSTSMFLPEQPEYNSHLGHNGTHFLYATVTRAYWSTDGINWNSKELAVLQYNNGTPVAYDWHGHDIIVFNESWSENAYIWSIFDIDGYVYTTNSDNLKVLDRVYDYNMNDVGQITNIDQVGTDDYSSIFVTLLSNETYSTVRNTTADFVAAVSLDIVNPDAIAIVNNTRTNEFVTIKQNGKDLSNSLYTLKPNDMVDLLSTGKINDMTIRSGTDFIHPAGCVARYIDYDTLGIKNLISNSIIETVLYGNGTYLAHYYDGIYISTDLINWEKSQTDFSVYGNVIFDGEKFVGIMEPNDTGYPTIYTSVDGKSWERGTQLASSGTVWYDYLCYNENGYLITEHSTSDVAYPVVFSTDLVNWTNLNPGNDPASYYHICAANSKAFVVGIAETGMTKAYVSTNGTTWTTVTLPETTTSSNSLSVLNDTFIYRLSSNTYKSTDGKNWTLFDYTLKIPNVYYDGNYYVSDDKAIYKSPDALSWEIVSGTEQYNNSNSTGGLETITSNGVMVIGIGTSGLALSAGSYTYFKPLNKTGKELHLYKADLAWGKINGDITQQTDLNTVLDKCIKMSDRQEQLPVANRKNAIAIGTKAMATGGADAYAPLAIGVNAVAGGSATAIGSNCFADAGSTAIGANTSSTDATYAMSGATALGRKARAMASMSVQIGAGVNNNANTLQFQNWQIIDANGQIPAERLTNVLGDINTILDNINGEVV